MIQFLTLMVFLFVGLAQTHSIAPSIGYGIAIPLAVITLVLAFIRYRKRSGGGD